MMSLVRMSAHLRNRAEGLIKKRGINDLACIQQAPDLATRSVTTIGGLCSALCRVDCVTVDSATDVRRLTKHSAIGLSVSFSSKSPINCGCCPHLSKHLNRSFARTGAWEDAASIG